MEYTLCFVISDDGHILMLRRSREPHRDRWNAPGGKLLPGESPRQGCGRELYEETGLTPVITDAGTIDCRDSRQPGIVYRLHVFTSSHPRVAVESGAEGSFSWLPLLQVLTDPQVVHNIPLFLPSVLKGKRIAARFQYDGDYLQWYRINLAVSGKGLALREYS